MFIAYPCLRSCIVISNYIWCDFLPIHLHKRSLHNMENVGVLSKGVEPSILSACELKSHMYPNSITIAKYWIDSIKRENILSIQYIHKGKHMTYSMVCITGLVGFEPTKYSSQSAVPYRLAIAQK